MLEVRAKSISGAKEDLASGESFEEVVTKMVLVLGVLVVLGEGFKGAQEERARRTLNFHGGLCVRE